MNRQHYCIVYQHAVIAETPAVVCSSVWDMTTTSRTPATCPEYTNDFVSYFEYISYEHHYISDYAYYFGCVSGEYQYHNDFVRILALLWIISTFCSITSASTTKAVTSTTCTMSVSSIT